MSARPARLYIAVRTDLPPGLQLSQALHAGQERVFEQPDAARAWRAESSTVVVVGVRDAAALERLHERAREAGVTCVLWRDPDLSPTLTAIALEPGDGARRLCRGLELALSPRRGQNSRHAVVPEEPRATL